jgi:soluble lytic murein transglycosylase
MTAPSGIGGQQRYVADRLNRRVRKKRLIRLVVWGTVIVIIAIVAALLVTGRTVVPVVSERLFPIHYRSEIAEASQTYGLDPYLVAAVVKTESGYDPSAVSSAGAVGLMQLMPETADWIAGLGSWRGNDRPELSDPGDNTQLGACYLAYLVDLFDDVTILALAAYNAGQGTVSDWVQLVGGGDVFTLSDIQYEETRDFVERVEYYRDLYSRIYPDAFAATD